MSSADSFQKQYSEIQSECPDQTRHFVGPDLGVICNS